MNRLQLKLRAKREEITLVRFGHFIWMNEKRPVKKIWEREISAKIKEAGQEKHVMLLYINC